MCACAPLMELDLFVLIDKVFGVVHEFLPLTSYLCTVYIVSQHIDCTMPLSEEERPQVGQSTSVQLQVSPLCTNNVTGKTFTITQLSKNNIN